MVGCPPDIEHSDWEHDVDTFIRSRYKSDGKQYHFGFDADCSRPLTIPLASVLGNDDLNSRLDVIPAESTSLLGHCGVPVAVRIGISVP